VTGRRRKLLDDRKERREYSHLKEEALNRTIWRTRFERGFGPVVRLINELSILKTTELTLSLPN
jgi:hypothetical protein